MALQNNIPFFFINNTGKERKNRRIFFFTLSWLQCFYFTPTFKTSQANPITKTNVNPLSSHNSHAATDSHGRLALSQMPDSSLVYAGSLGVVGTMSLLCFIASEWVFETSKLSCLSVVDNRLECDVLGRRRSL